MSAATRPSADAPTLRVRGLTVGYGAAPVVRGLDLDVLPGEVLGLIGPNGAGKSTLLRALLGRLPALSGTVETPDGPVAGLRARERARRIAFLPQETALDLALPVREIVAMGRYAHRRRGQRAHPGDAAAVETAFARTGTGHLAERDVNTLSGGQRQLVLVAKLLAQGSATLLLDEPVSALDLGYQLDVLELLRSLSRAGHAVVVVLHDLNLAARYCDRLALMRDGELRGVGAPAEVLTVPALREAYRIEAALDNDPVSGLPRVTAVCRCAPASDHDPDHRTIPVGTPPVVTTPIERTPA